MEALLAFVGIIVGSGATYLIARRQRSGRIDTTEAAQLWAESNAMRQELREEIVSRREEVVRLRSRHVKCEEDLAQVKRTIRALQRKLRLANDG